MTSFFQLTWATSATSPALVPPETKSCKIPIFIVSTFFFKNDLKIEKGGLISTLHNLLTNLLEFHYQNSYTGVTNIDASKSAQQDSN